MKDLTIHIGEHGVATFSASVALDFSGVKGCKAFYCDSYKNGDMHLKRVDGVVPPHFGLLLTTDDEKAADVVVPVASKDSKLKGNLFIATDEAPYLVAEGETILALGVKDGKAGFYYVAPGVSVPQGRCYLVQE